MIMILDNVWLELLGMLMTILALFTTSFYLSKMLTPRRESKFYMFKYFGSLVIIYLFSRINMTLYELRDFMLTSAIFALPFFLSKDKPWKKLSTSLLWMISVMLLSTLSNYIDLVWRLGYTVEEVNSMASSAYEELLGVISNGWNFITLNGFQYTGLAFLETCTLLLFNRGLKNKREIFVISLISYLLVASSTLPMLLYVDTENPIHALVGLGTNATAVFLMLYSYSKLRFYQDYYESLAENKFLKKKEMMQLEYYEIVRKKEEEIRKINHDIKNNLQVIYSLMNENEKKKLISKIDENLKKHELKKYSKNDILNIVLNTKVQEAERNGIKIELVVRHDLDFMDDLDVSNLFSNILSNAIKGTRDAKKKTIDLGIICKMGLIYVKCTNSLAKIKGQGVKNDLVEKEEHHGYGLKIMDEIVKKYDGEMNIDKSDDFFEVVITIPQRD